MTYRDLNYRARNLRTGDILVTPDEVVRVRPTDSEEHRDWVLEFEVTDSEWLPSGFHHKDILGVKDPCSYTEIISVLKEIA
jgi:hypothetical protein